MWKNPPKPADNKPGSTALTVPPAGIPGLAIVVGGRRYPVASYAEASAMFETTRDAVEDLGPGAGGASRTPTPIIERDGQPIGYVSYNGRVWSGDPEGPDRSNLKNLLFDPGPPSAKQPTPATKPVTPQLPAPTGGYALPPFVGAPYVKPKAGLGLKKADPTGTPNEVFRSFKTALTRAINAKDWQAVIAEADRFEAYYSRPESPPFPDDHHRWKRAKEDAEYALKREGITTTTTRPPAKAGLGLKPKTEPKPEPVWSVAKELGISDEQAAYNYAVQYDQADSFSPGDGESDLEHNVLKALTALLAADPSALSTLSLDAIKRHLEGIDYVREDAPDEEWFNPGEQAEIDRLEETLSREQLRREGQQGLDFALPTSKPERNVEESDAEGDPSGERALGGRRPAGAGEPGAPAGGPGDAGPEGVAGDQPATPGQVPQQPAKQARARKRGAKRRVSGVGTEPPAPGGPAGPEPGGRPGADEASHVDTADVAGSQEVADAHARGQAPRWFSITDSTALTEGGWTRKLEDNLAALRLLKQLEREARPASDAEQAVLARYIGWGHTELAAVVNLLGADHVTDPRKKQAREELDNLLTKAEVQELGESTANAHYSFADLPRAMWDLVGRLGFTGGSILEPAVGTGHFLGTMPGAIRTHRATRVWGVDKEPIASAIARQLYQGANILTSPLEEAVLPENYFDLILSNVPFGKIQIFDPAFVSAERTPLVRSIHNYYFAKALDLARPGGLVVFVTSRYTLDAQSDTTRAYLAKRADFLGAFRLPDQAFKGTAGTEVITDVIVLQKRAEGAKPKADAPAWLKAVARPELGKVWDEEKQAELPTYTNEYFLAHPAQVLGKEARSGKMHGRPNNYNVEGTLTPAQLEDAVTGITGGRALSTLERLAAEAKARIAARGTLSGTRIGTGLPADDFADMVIIGASKIAGGVVKFAQWSKAMLEDFGEYIRPHLKAVYDAAKAQVAPTQTTPVYRPPTAPPRTIAKVQKDAKQGSFIVEAGKLYTYDKGTLVPSDLKGTDLKRALAFVPLRDAYHRVLDAMMANASNEDLAMVQELMTLRYEAFVDAHGYLNLPENTRVLEADPNVFRVLGLENFDRVKGTKKGERTRIVILPGKAGRADIFSKRLMRPPQEPTSAASPHDALVQSIAWKGGVDLAYMESLTGQPIAQLTEALAEDIFHDPAAQGWVAKDEYLSGDVVTKLAQAEAAAQADARYAPNVVGLKGVQPRPLTIDDFTGPEDIARSILFGATYVPVPLVERFLHENGGAGVEVRLLNSASKVEWYVHGWGRSEFLLAGVDYEEWVAHALNGALPTITVKDSQGAVDPVATKDATERYRQSLGQLKEQWDQWWKSDGPASTQLVSMYNALFNREVIRVFDGTRLVTPNSNPEIVLRDGQKQSVMGALHRGNSLLAQVPGWGKTFEMIAIAGEWKRLGFANKPMIVVPNHIVEQWRRDFIRFYPAARVLLPETRDYEAGNRKRLIARIANNEWDTVVVGMSQFLKMGVKLETLKAFVKEQEDQLLAQGAEELGLSAEEFSDLVTAYGENDKDAKRAISGRGVPRSVKDVARAILNLRKRLRQRTDQQGSDPINFEELGVDGLMVDEAHMFKNLYFYSSKNNIVGLKGSDADQAIDMYLKVRHINALSNNRNVVFATGTPITNTMSEIFTVFRYLAQTTLDRLGMAGFDSWANGYAVAEESSEPRPEGGYKERTRLSKWANLQELSRLFKRFADVITKEDVLKENARLVALGLPPLLKLPKETKVTIELEPHPEMEAFMADLRDRIERIKKGDPKLLGVHKDGRPKLDNHLTVTTSASLAAIDLRLVLPNAADDPNGRMRVAAREIATRYRASMATKGVQLVFLDVGVPHGTDIPPLPASIAHRAVEEKGEDTEEDTGDFVNQEAEAEAELEGIRSLGLDKNLYGELKRLLVETGLKADEIAFIHQATNPSEQARLSAAVNAGDIRVLIMTRAKGGTGLNVQKRATTVHHLDVPWRPDQMEQADARAVRQGNENEAVEILRYVTKRSFDEYRWYQLAKKQGFIAQFYRGELGSAEDIDTTQLDMQVASAIASGDERWLQMIQIERQLRGLRARRDNYQRRHSQAERDKRIAAAELALREKDLPHLRQLETEAQAWESAKTIVIDMKPSRYYGLDDADPQTFDFTKKADPTPEDKEALTATRKRLAETLAPLMRIGHLNDADIGRAGPFILARNTVTREARYVAGTAATGAILREGTSAGVLTVKVHIGDAERAIGTTPEWDDEHPPDLVQSLGYHLDPKWPTTQREHVERRIAEFQRELAAAEAILTKKFEQQDALEAKEAELEELRVALGVDKAPPAPTAAELAAMTPDQLQKAGTRLQRKLDALQADMLRPGLTQARSDEIQRQHLDAFNQLEAVQARTKPAGGTLDTLEQNAKARIDERGTFKGGRLTAGLPVDDLADLVVIGAVKIAKGAIKFSVWSAQMVAEFGERIRPHLRTIYARAQAKAGEMRPRYVPSGRDVPDATPIPEEKRLEFPSLGKMPEPIREDLADLLNQYQGFQGQRRNVQPITRTQELAKDVWLPLESLKPGTALNAEELEAYKTALATVLTERQNLLPTIQSGDATDWDRLRFSYLTDVAVTFTMSYRGAKAEAGRALRILRVKARVLDLQESKFLEAALAAPGFREDLKAVAAAAVAAQGDPVKQLQILRQRARGTWFDYVQAFYYTNLLSGLKTHLRNTIGNSFNMAANLLTPLGAVPADVVRTKATGQARTAFLGEIPASVVGGLIGFHQGMLNAGFTFRYGFRPSTVEAAESGVFDTPRIELPGGVWTNWPARSLDAADEFFRAIARQQERYAGVYAQAQKERTPLRWTPERMAALLASPSPTTVDGALMAVIDERADTFAARAVFQEPPGAIVKWLLKAKAPTSPTPLRAAALFVAPFIRISGAILRQGFEFSPAGFAMKAARQGGRAGAQAQGRAILGTAFVLGPVAWLAAMGMLTGAPPEDEGEREEFYAQGKLANAVRIKDYWVRYVLFQPFSVTMAAVANAWTRFESSAQDEAAAQEAFAAGVAGAGASLLDQSFLAGLGAFIDAVNDPTRYGGRWLALFAQGFVPFSGMARNVTQAVDPVYRKPEGVKESVQSIIPGQSDELVPRRTRFGEEATRTGPWWQRGFVVPEVSKAVDDRVTTTLARLQVRPAAPRPALTLRGERVPLTREQEDVISHAIGREKRAAVERLLALPTFEARSDDQQREALEDAMTAAASAVRQRAVRAVVNKTDLTLDRLVSERVLRQLADERAAFQSLARPAEPAAATAP